MGLSCECTDAKPCDTHAGFPNATTYSGDAEKNLAAPPVEKADETPDREVECCPTKELAHDLVVNGRRAHA